MVCAAPHCRHLCTGSRDRQRRCIEAIPAAPTITSEARPATSLSNCPKHSGDGVERGRGSMRPLTTELPLFRVRWQVDCALALRQHSAGTCSPRQWTPGSRTRRSWSAGGPASTAPRSRPWWARRRKCPSAGRPWAYVSCSLGRYWRVGGAWVALVHRPGAWLCPSQRHHRRFIAVAPGRMVYYKNMVDTEPAGEFLLSAWRFAALGRSGAPDSCRGQTRASKRGPLRRISRCGTSGTASSSPD